MPKSQTYSRRAFILKNLSAGTALFTGFWMLGSCQAARPAAHSQAPASAPAPQPAAQPSPQAPAAATANAAAAEPCDDLTGVSAGEIDKRKKLAYVGKSPIPDSHCANCSLYVPPAEGKGCGGCMLFKGPVRAGGYCTYWAPIS